MLHVHQRQSPLAHLKSRFFRRLTLPSPRFGILTLKISILLQPIRSLVQLNERVLSLQIYREYLKYDLVREK